MDPQQQISPLPPSQGVQQPPQLPQVPQELPPYKPNHKKGIIFSVVLVLLLIGGGLGGYFYYQHQQEQHRLAVIQAKRDAKEKAAAEKLKKLKEGTAKELETLIDTESKGEADNETLTIQHDTDAIAREAQLATQIGSDNEKNL